MRPPITPFRGRRPPFLQVTGRVKGESLWDAFSGQDVRKKPRRRPAGCPAKQQSEAALEAVRHLSR